MPDRLNLTPVQEAWLIFTDACRLLLGPQSDDRPLDQYLAFRDRVLALVQGDAFLGELETGWSSANKPPTEVADALLLELTVFSRAVEVANTTATSDQEKKGWFRRLLSKGSTVAGSVDELIKDLPPLAKGGIKLFRELVDLFRSKE